MSLDIPGGEDAISIFQLADWRQAKKTHVLLDVREAAELDICRIEDAVLIPMAEVPSRLGELPTNVPLVVLCHHGMRSQRVVDFLRKAGFDNAVNLDGGIDAWATEIDPAVSRY